MSETIRVIRQAGVENPAASGGFRLFSKWFDVHTSKVSTVTVHEDYPNITAEDIREFLRFCDGRTTPVMTGCRSDIHPYRLIYATEDGTIRPYAIVPQAIRGNRHLYPEVFQAVPALFYCPSGMSPARCDLLDSLQIYVMEKEKLLDKTRFPDRLFL